MTRPTITINNRTIGEDYPAYFIADIAANHDGQLDRAIQLVDLAKEMGADAVKFQNFKAETIVSDYGFKNLSGAMSHQKKWKTSVFEVYKSASIPFEWTFDLKDHCKKVGIDYFSAPYDLDAVDFLEPHMPAYKIGSGDITWQEIIEKMAQKNKPVLLATGAATMEDVERAVDAILRFNSELVLMQCNTNYTGSLENFKYVNLKVIQTYKTKFPDLVLGLSDHTPGHATVLGAVAFGARVIEKHFTDDTGREGPDHPFSMDGSAWKEMVDRTRELEAAFGDGVKRVEDNEAQTVILQQRSIRATVPLQKGDVITADKIEMLRPCPKDAFKPFDVDQLLGKRVTNPVEQGAHIPVSSVAD